MHRQKLLQSSPIPFAFRISHLSNFYTASVYREIAQQFGVARSEYVILFCLRNLGIISAQDICDITGRPKNSVSRAVNALLERGLIARETDPIDARRALLSLTRSGASLHDAAIHLLHNREQIMLAPLNGDERLMLDRLLAKLVLRDDDWSGVLGEDF